MYVGGGGGGIGWCGVICVGGVRRGRRYWVVWCDMCVGGVRRGRRYWVVWCEDSL